MNGEHIDIKSVFLEALEKKTPEGRRAYLAQVCGTRPELQIEFESLLRAHEAAGDFLETPPLGESVVLDEPPVAEGPGTVIGRYKLLERIGEGGMAVVYMAEQAPSTRSALFGPASTGVLSDSKGTIRRKVALKIIKLGMDTRQVIARFEAERQALAMMDHPNIAKVLDAGATETGRPYFVMELVQGVSITEYCDKNSLSTKDRLGLFLAVCNAVQHAHQKGIIHRDLKPSNVMVTHHDGKPVPKVIDFGIAKATNQKLTEKTLFTRYAHIIGTPAYMSPEQAELSDLDIDTRTDIYSLGVLLYELLTGTTPFSEEELRKAGYIEMQRVIREQEPARPSTKLSTLGKTSTEVARRRNCTPDLLRKAVRGDLDWIVMKSLEKDRARRYETASGLAEDIRRHLEHEPVLARGPGVAYRVERFLRRHRSQVVSAFALAVVAGVVVVILSMWNRDRVQLAEAEGFKHRSILSQAREQYAKAERDAALETIRPILDSRHAGAEARLLEATILVDNRQSKEAVTVLDRLLDEQPEIAGAAHSLLARILWESGSPDAQKLEEIEEHRRKAEELLPETAEAYFLRAMTALTVKEQLASLDRALQLDPGHYESRRLRAYTYYASRKYDRLRDDALAMTILRPRDPLGYSLRAAALRELGKYEEAIAAYDNAMALMSQADPQYSILLEQRSEVLLRMGEYERLIADAAAGAKDLSPLRYHLFAALTALGQYDEATILFREIIAPGHEARQKFNDWCGKYVFDTLAAGRLWHLTNQEPTGAAFLPMIEAEETYRNLSAKGAQRLTTDGFSAQWSPDGKKLAFSLGVQGRSGVAIFDPATKETDLLIVPGKDPKWSPDGRYIAFVRDREGLRLEELTVADRASQRPPETGEEVWVMNADGTAPRRLAQGSWPTWASDSTAFYYLSRGDGTLSRLSLVDPAATPKPIMKWSNVLPSVSPDSRQVAHFEDGLLKITDLASQKVVAECKGPPMSWGTASWSPTGSEVCLGGGNPQRDKTGLWIYGLGSKQFLKVFDGQITATSWSRGGREFAFCLGAPYHEIWGNSLNAGMSAADALGACQTLERHYRDMVAFYTRRIKADPMDADAYLRRAQQYHFLCQDVKVHRDMRLYSAIMTQGKLPDIGLGSPSGHGHVIYGPFGYQVVLSAEERDDGTEALSVAFGQKGRCMMKLVEIPMCVASLVGFGLLASVEAPPAYADFTFGEPVRTAVRINGDYDSRCFSYDGLEMYIDGMLAGGQGAYDLWVLRRASKDEDWGAPENLGAAVNSPSLEAMPCIAADGLSLYFCSDRPHGNNETFDVFVATRPSKNDPWGQALRMGPEINGPGGSTFGVWITPDNLELYIASWRSGGYGNRDIYVSRRATTNDPWGNAVNLGPIVNTTYTEGLFSLSPDGLLLLFSQSWGTTGARPGGYGLSDLWMSRRASLSDLWQMPVNLGAAVNSPAQDCAPRVSPDGRTLYFFSQRAGSWEHWEAPIDPIVDLNGDGKVDDGDILVMRLHWGQDYPPCDIGPFPWGDGIVDMQDIKVLMSYTGGTATEWTEPAMNPSPGALDVPRDVILSWTSAGLGEAHDVYFGTSLDDVTSAERDNPLGVLVSQSQVETIYDPPGLLEFGRTYYWRIDEVGGASDSTIYKGPVLNFATELLAYPIEAVVATSNAVSEAGAGAENTVNGSGLNAAGEHSTSAGNMWLATKSADESTWIQYEFDGVYALHEMWVWNYNSQFEPVLGFGLKDVTVEYSANGTDWATLGDFQLAQATAKGTYTHNTAIDFAGVAAKYIRLVVHSGWGTLSAQYGLSEVRFFYLPVYSSKPSPVSGRKGIGVDTVLTWKAGRKAASHQVHLSTDQQVVTNGVAPVAAVTDARFDPEPLDLGRTYYWRIDEVNEAEAVSVWEGAVWDFSTLEYLLVDDFESYNDEEGQGTCIYQSWIDGWTNGTGSRVGNLSAPFAEQNVVHRGRQAMPLAYNNSESPFYSQTERILSMIQDWTTNGADTLTLWFRGNPMDFLERADGSIQMSGGGADIWDTSDQFRFAHRKLNGDGSIVARVHSLTNTHIWAKAGVMIRGSLAPASAYAFMFPTPDGRRAFQHRTSSGGMAVTAHSNAGAVTFPLWVKVERKGSNFTGYYSHDGQNWTVSTPDDATSNSTNPVRVLLTGEVYIGLAVTSHNLSMPTIAEFSSVSFAGEVTGQWQVEAIGVEQPSNDLAPLYVTVEDDAGHSKAVTHPDPAAVQTIDWQPWMIPLSEFTSAGVTMTNVKKMSIGVGDQRSATAGGAGVIYIDDIGFGHPLSSD